MGALVLVPDLPPKPSQRRQPKESNESPAVRHYQITFMSYWETLVSTVTIVRSPWRAWATRRRSNGSLCNRGRSSMAPRSAAAMGSGRRPELGTKWSNENIVDLVVAPPKILDAGSDARSAPGRDNTETEDHSARARWQEPSNDPTVLGDLDLLPVSARVAITLDR